MQGLFGGAHKLLILSSFWGEKREIIVYGEIREEPVKASIKQALIIVNIES